MAPRQPPSSVGAPGHAEDAEALGRRLVGLLDVIAEQGHRPVGEPVEQRRAFGIVDRLGVLAHLAPAASASRAPRGERRSSTRLRSAASSCRPRASARSSSMYIIDSRRLLSSHSGSTSRSAPLSSRLDADDRVKQAMDGQLPRGDGVGDRIDQERHVVVDDADAHPAIARFAAGRLDRQREFAALAALGGDLGEEFGGLTLRLAATGPGFRREGHFWSAPCELTRPAAGPGAYGPSWKDCCSASEGRGGGL